VSVIMLSFKLFIGHYNSQPECYFNLLVLRSTDGSMITRLLGMYSMTLLYNMNLAMGFESAK